ncbi:hypothetical protein GGR56DRAFT_633554 [Xylariaceae sp. FL0804]|nr:hypothetical protein GGR56DRAFT_633554 [Xylariaceae sp. FL0804]
MAVASSFLILPFFTTRAYVKDARARDGRGEADIENGNGSALGLERKRVPVNSPMHRSSSGLNRAFSGLSSSESMPPVAKSLMQRAPRSTCRCTPRQRSSTLSTRQLWPVP